MQRKNSLSCRVGVVVLNYNSAALTIRCVESIMKKCVIHDLHFYIVDNASTDDSVKIVSEKFDGLNSIEILANENNEGYSSGNNRGIEKAEIDGCEYIVISNPDVYLINDAISILIDSLIEHENLCIAGPHLDQPNHLGQFARKPLTFTMAFWNKGFLRIFTKSRFKARNYDWDGKQQIIFSGMVAGCFFVARASYLKKIGNFDKDFFLYYEEDVLAYKMITNEFECMINPKALVYHDHGEITKNKGNSFIFYHYRISEFLLLCKYSRLTFSQKIIIYIRNIVWFWFYSITNKEARSYIGVLIKKYNLILKGRYGIKEEADNEF